jgi:hypothetical protein
MFVLHSFQDLLSAGVQLETESFILLSSAVQTRKCMRMARDNIHVYGGVRFHPTTSLNI